MEDELAEKARLDNTTKYRVGMALSVILVAVYLKNELKEDQLIKVVGVGIPISLLIFLATLKLDLIRKKYAKGIGGIAFAVSLLMWKRIHAYSITLEALLMLVLAITGFFLSFKYSGAELEGKFD